MLDQQASVPAKEEPEGLGNDPAGESSSGELPTYPIDTLMIRTENRTVHDILRRLERGDYILNPEFQRDFVWDQRKQSKLIESVLMRIPLPVFYFAENDDGKNVVVDGLQRISTLQHFVNEDLRLKLPNNTNLHKKKFSELDTKLKNRIEDCNLTLYLIDAKVDERIRLDIFERVNAGVPLTRQQMRNCLYTGPATAFVKEYAHGPLFLEATGKSLNADEMRDREFVTRYCAFQLFGYKAYRGDMDEYLANALKHMNVISAVELANLGEQFMKSLRINYTLFRQHAFRRFLRFDQHRSALNASLWDVMSTVFVPYDEQKILVQADEVVSALWNLFEDDEFIHSITISTNDTKKIMHRFERVNRVMKEILGDHTN